MAKCLAAVDIGNTNINIGIFRGRRLVKRQSVPTGKRISSLRRGLKGRLGIAINKIIIVSVVPGATKRFLADARRGFGQIPIYTVGRDINVPIKSHYNKREIGQDRLVTAYAALKLYGAPCLVIDFGTAVTFDAVNGNGEYLGGLILPGIKMSLDSLYRKTALLPKVLLRRTKGYIGRDTKASIINGMVYGYTGICEGLVSRARKELGRKMKVIATGGDAALISAYTGSIDVVDPDLSLKGLRLLTD